MPESKTIEIDEIVTPEKPGSDTQKRAQKSPRGTSRPDEATGTPTGSDPFAEMERALPWKARWTLKLTRWFMLLRSKPWGKIVLIPAIILGALLAIPLSLIAICFLIIRSFIRSLAR